MPTLLHPSWLGDILQKFSTVKGKGDPRTAVEDPGDNELCGRSGRFVSSFNFCTVLRVPSATSLLQSLSRKTTTRQCNHHLGVGSVLSFLLQRRTWNWPHQRIPLSSRTHQTFHGGSTTMWRPLQHPRQADVRVTRTVGARPASTC